jgi:hypothetical protein
MRLCRRAMVIKLIAYLNGLIDAVRPKLPEAFRTLDDRGYRGG